MPKQGQGNLLERLFLWSDVAILLLAWLAPLFIPGLTPQNRALLYFLGIFAIGFGLSLLAFTRIYRPWRRRRDWQRIMSDWEESSTTRRDTEFNLAPHLSEGGLMFLAIFLYTEAGYLASEPGEEDPHAVVTLVNPLGKTELVYCKQSHEPAGIELVNFLHAAVSQAGALRGFLWAPGGFSSEALAWAQDKPLILADSHEIGRLFDVISKKKMARNIFERGEPSITGNP